MAITTAVFYPQLNDLVHQLYAISKRIADLQVTMGVSNATVNTIVTQVKGDRANLVNTTHTSLIATIGAL